MRVLYEATLKRVFGYESFRPGQHDIIHAVIEGQDVLAVMPTGAGKSLTFQLPSYIKNQGLTVIVSPLLSLIEDQMLHIRERGERGVARLTSMESAEEKQDIINHLKRYRFLYLSPEQLAVPYVTRALANVKIQMLVIDEAHCISQWGHEFRPEYARLGELRKQIGSPQCMAVTATAPEGVKQDIIEKLALFSPEQFVHSANRPEIRLLVERLEKEKKLERLKELIQVIPKPAVVYTATRREAEALAFELEDALFYHGGMSTEDRRLVQSQFLRDEVSVMVCTSAFGMGVNKDNVRSVVHFQLPATVEAYMQEIGRAGRDGQPAFAVLLYADGDERIQQFLIDGQYPKDEDMRLAYFERENGTSLAQLPRLLRMNEEDPKFLLLKQLLTERSLQEALDWVKERKRDRYRQLGQMMDYALIRTCRRDYLLRYFSEQTVDQEECCDVCGPIPFPDTPQIVRKNVTEWKIRLTQIFSFE
ncbi:MULTISPECIES: ATP-dependent DNA helicase RecQ [unclassified Exiguobacterium]|uniref:RecQ family ATP-dependent DNA helicase n=1 Tax=unclassified Exiguobacterium TaxID=2644629 RepID=UPI0021F47809|nr:MULTISPECIES: ATP-dependent DNA helicase RecQ [unclassified Exiguobacterium]MCV9899039.1 ATP-dependent DNA helicase [Exiguobacterium sp. N5]MDT0191342.1 ATP-dependent DNA helicase RecQ [Exiguobacterium sp. BG5(2022)]